MQTFRKGVRAQWQRHSDAWKDHLAIVVPDELSDNHRLAGIAVSQSGGKASDPILLCDKKAGSSTVRAREACGSIKNVQESDGVTLENGDTLNKDCCFSLCTMLNPFRSVSEGVQYHSMGEMVDITGGSSGFSVGQVGDPRGGADLGTAKDETPYAGFTTLDRYLLYESFFNPKKAHEVLKNTAVFNISDNGADLGWAKVCLSDQIMMPTLDERSYTYASIFYSIFATLFYLFLLAILFYILYELLIRK